MFLLSLPASAAKIVFLAGAPSHGPGEHEHRAGCLLLASCLEKLPGITVSVYSNGWPAAVAEETFAGASTIVVYSDGEGHHPFFTDAHLETIRPMMDKGVGLVCIHYATEPPKGEGKDLLEWMGGYFEVNWSVNPTWTPDFKVSLHHPITRGVGTFSVQDEWYFHIRFHDKMKGAIPVLQAVPPQSTMGRGDGPHEGNPAVREAVKRREPQVVAWACERPNGGRGFGFTGAHYHRNWGNPDFRKLVLNAILWTAKVEVPRNGVESVVSAEQLQENLDAKGR